MLFLGNDCNAMFYYASKNVSSFSLQNMIGSLSERNEFQSLKPYQKNEIVVAYLEKSTPLAAGATVLKGKVLTYARTSQRALF